MKRTKGSSRIDELGGLVPDVCRDVTASKEGAHVIGKVVAVVVQQMVTIRAVVAKEEEMERSKKEERAQLLWIAKAMPVPGSLHERKGGGLPIFH